MLEKIWRKILKRGTVSLWAIPAFILWLVSFLYRIGFAVKRMTSGQAVKVKVPVISVGNLTVGGSGKTPLVHFIANDLINAGIRVGIVSSGYARSDTEPFMAVGYDVVKMDVNKTGDEVMLLSSLLPQAYFSVHPIKLNAAEVLADSGQVDVIVVDDGFQHFTLARDVDIVAYDAGVSRKLLKPLPYGILREPLRAIKRADIIIITRARFATDLSKIKKRLGRINKRADIYSAVFKTDSIRSDISTLPDKYLEDKSVFLFAGVGNFTALTRQVTALVSDLDYAMELSDHQEYDGETLEHIKIMASKYDSDLILTTYKDWVKLGGFDFNREIYYLEQSVDLDPGEERLLADLTKRLNLPLSEN